MTHCTRRDFLKTGAGAGAAALLAGARPAAGRPRPSAAAPSAPRVVSSGNGIRATARAMEILRAGGDPSTPSSPGSTSSRTIPTICPSATADCPTRTESSSSIRRSCTGRRTGPGRWPRSRNIKNPSKVARLVMERTNHVLLVGEGALKFARAHGFKEEDLLTERSREAWLRWRETMSDVDNWFPPKAAGACPRRCARSCRPTARSTASPSTAPAVWPA
ncbi:MAG: isoaspartyl peptidase/L-asparaginase [Desulfobacterales bacterium]|nr:isoaspartyl peptidase/L-asparaginase [Desulfobacterales bacterium]